MFRCQWFSSHWVERGRWPQRPEPNTRLVPGLFLLFPPHLLRPDVQSTPKPWADMWSQRTPPQEEAAGKHTHMTDATALVTLQDTWPENTPLPSRSSSPTSGLGDPSHPNSKCPPHFRYGKATHPAWGACLPHPTLPVNPPSTWAHYWEEPGATNVDDEVSR